MLVEGRGGGTRKRLRRPVQSEERASARRDARGALGFGPSSSLVPHARVLRFSERASRSASLFHPDRPRHRTTPSTSERASTTTVSRRLATQSRPGPPPPLANVRAPSRAGPRTADQASAPPASNNHRSASCDPARRRAFIPSKPPSSPAPKSGPFLKMKVGCVCAEGSLVVALSPADGRCRLLRLVSLSLASRSRASRSRGLRPTISTTRSACSSACLPAWAPRRVLTRSTATSLLQFLKKVGARRDDGWLSIDASSSYFLWLAS